MIYHLGSLPPRAVVRGVDDSPAGPGRLLDPLHDVTVSPVLLLGVNGVLPLVKVAEKLRPVALGAVPPNIIPVSVT